MTIEFIDPTLVETAQALGKLKSAFANAIDDPAQGPEVLKSVVELRLWNRAAQDAVKKGSTALSKQNVDDCRLDIQNITYKHKHLRTEIEQNREYESKHEQLDMIPVEEFLEEHPEFKELSEHDLIKERIKDEEKRRLELFLVKTKLLQELKGLKNEVKSQRAALEDKEVFEGHINSMLEATNPMQRFIDKHAP